MRSLLTKTSAALVSIGIGLCLSGCAAFPELRPADVRLPDTWHATRPHDGSTSELVTWWGTFNDPSLIALIRLAQDENPTVASAVADIERARATLASEQANLFPVLDGSASATRSGTDGSSSNRVAAGTLSSGGLDASWEVDLFGKVRQKTEAAGLRVDQRVDDWYDTRVSLAAEVADYYVQYRACRQLENAYSVELTSQRETIRATETAAASGLTSSADLALARASAASSSSTLTAQRTECNVLIISLAQVTGGDEAAVRRLLAQGKPGLPAPKSFQITAVPAEALRQRPDINALELEVAAAVADVGAAKADLYPSLSLAGSVTISSSTLTGAALPWSFGPALTIPLFDGGARRATVMGAIADYDTAAANYKSGVLSAVAEVETALVRIDSTRRRISDASSAARNYRTYFNAIDTNWRAGGVSLLDREEARRAAQSSEISLIEIRRDAVRYWIALYKALGGGWDAGAGSPPGHSSTIQGNQL
ncbi:efflux transporter, outer membrane factor (OMF) lipoprotein, NodT family [Ancylobacter rudongensis]|uniref:Efflux transporter, outer membrane factor (OMF) lipoprotein, NodT family n=1 Tax=Ancylobacter rudongensis TaxID=177413 RepID=A0A1G4SYB9_9HYPH|nr:efflux transporter, outer membrane factor (OMF) lipoprotein, NodT family [Ancylobacter rudongensis]